ncbi:hypothetical protein PMIT1342_01613 [Prochlorococcus marinus str. MIT 1342]|nr:hypothetical protein PMIT1312_02475 [Prochlorococcus marinus str. MIT 1312]KZR79663.1 hypothetical protein PMIT1327_01722 [Prochlorococcus marinus str. MIT 1327]KZR81278.1 hypothetical protein PMIT1342_01613 [Prochlorococcus marinus str. MIT 1342]
MVDPPRILVRMDACDCAGGAMGEKEPKQGNVMVGSSNAPQLGECNDSHHLAYF